MTRNVSKKTHPRAILSAIMIASTLMSGSMALAASEPLPPVPERFSYNGLGTTKGMNINSYCKREYGSKASQYLGESKWWNAWACEVKTYAGSSFNPVNMLDVCRYQHPGSRPVNPTGNAYNWYCLMPN